MKGATPLVVAQTDLSAFLPGWSWVPDFLSARYPADSLTLRTQKFHWQAWTVFLISNKIESPSIITRDTAGQFLRWRCETVQRVTAVRQVLFLHFIMEEAALRGLCSKNPLHKLHLSVGPVPEKPEVTPDLEAELRSAIDHADTHKDFLRVSMELGIYQGRRIAETRLLLDNVNFDNNQIRFWVKGGRWHPAPLHPRIRAMLLDLKKAGNKWTFEHPADRTLMSSTWHAFLARHGFIERYPHLCFHSFRVTCVSRLARAGVTESKAMRFVGHSNTLVHRLYMRLKLEDLSDCVAALK